MKACIKFGIKDHVDVKEVDINNQVNVTEVSFPDTGWEDFTKASFILENFHFSSEHIVSYFVNRSVYSTLGVYLYMTCVLVVTASWRNLLVHMIKHQYACNFLEALDQQDNHTQQKNIESLHIQNHPQKINSIFSHLWQTLGLYK